MTFVSIIRQEGGGGGGGFFHFLSCPRKTLARAPSSNTADRLPCVMIRSDELNGARDLVLCFCRQKIKRRSI